MAVRPLRMYLLCDTSLSQILLLENYLYFCLFLLSYRIKKHVESKLKRTTHIPFFITCMSISRKIFSMLSIKWPLTDNCN